MAGDVPREGSREGQGWRGGWRRGYFWCCMHAAIVPLCKPRCLLDGLALLCSPPLCRCHKDETAVGKQPLRKDVWRREGAEQDYLGSKVKRVVLRKRTAVGQKRSKAA